MADNPHFALGREREIAVRDEYNFKNLSNLQPVVCCLDENPRIMASLDGYENGKIIELKSTSKPRELWQDIIDYSAWQIIHQVFITKSSLAQLLITNENGTEEIEVTCGITEKARAAWLEHCNNYLNLLDEAKSDKNSIDIMMYIDIKNQIKELEAQLEPIKDKLIADNPDGLVSSCLTISKQIKKTNDYKKFLEDNKLTFSDNYIKTSESYVIRIKENKNV